MAQRLGIVKKWLFLPIFTIFGQTGGYTSPFGLCDTALSCPDQVYYLLGRNWDSTWPNRSTFPMAQRLGLVKKWLFLPIFTIFGQTGGYTCWSYSYNTKSLSVRDSYNNNCELKSSFYLSFVVAPGSSVLPSIHERYSDQHTPAVFNAMKLKLSRHSQVYRHRPQTCRVSTTLLFSSS